MTRQGLQRSARCLVPMAAALAISCHGMFEPRHHDAGDTDADLDGDSDADHDQDADLDDDATDGDEADVDRDPDGDATRLLGVTAATATLPPTEHRAGTSVVLDLTTTWSRDPIAGVSVEIAASGGGLVSFADDPGVQPSVRLVSSADGNLPNIRVTFPLEPWPYGVELSWADVASGAGGEVEGVHSFSVVAPDRSLTRHWLGTTPVDVVPGLATEDYALVGGFVAEEFDGSWNELTAMTFTTGAYGEHLVVSSSFTACFVDAEGAASCETTRPAAADAEGPDQIVDLAFFPGGPAGDPPPLLLAAGGGLDAGGGLYRIFTPSENRPPERIFEAASCWAVDFVAAHDRLEPGLYFGDSGYVRRWSPGEAAFETFCPSYRPYPYSLAIGDEDTYGLASFFTSRCSDFLCSSFVVERVGAACGHEEVATAGSPWRIRRSPGTVFGRMLFAVHEDRVVLFVEGEAGLSRLDVILFPEGTGVIDVAFADFRPGVGHPDGLYVLVEGADLQGRVIRVFQDLVDRV